MTGTSLWQAGQLLRPADRPVDRQYRASKTWKIEARDRLIEWLPANVPQKLVRGRRALCGQRAAGLEYLRTARRSGSRPPKGASHRYFEASIPRPWTDR